MVVNLCISLSVSLSLCLSLSLSLCMSLSVTFPRGIVDGQTFFDEQTFKLVLFKLVLVEISN